MTEPTHKPTSGQPDMILVMSDEHSPQFSAPYGHPIVRTPNLSRLAAEGRTFDAAYCGSPVCVPSRMSFMTASLPSSIEVWDNGTPLRSDVPTLAHSLRSRGYETVLIGKMHFIGPDQLHGFNRRPVEDSRVCGTSIDTTDWDEPDRPRSGSRKRLSQAGAGRTRHIEHDEDVLASALELLANLPPREERAPLFLVVSFNAPHFPLRAPEHFEDYWPDNVDMPRIDAGELEAQHPFHKRLRRHFCLEDVSAGETKRGRAAFYALVTWFDDQVGRVLDAVEASPGLEREATVTGYISDHGDMAGEHGLWWKCCFFEESARVPMILRWPGRVPAGTRCASPVSLLDLSLTLDRIGASDADASETAFSAAAEGGDIRPLLFGGEDGGRAVISEYYAHGAGLPIRMIRHGHHKYVHYHGEPAELYDLASDPGEKHNLAGLPDYAECEHALRARVLEGWDPDGIDAKVRRSQRDRRLIAGVGGHGTFE